MTEIDTIERGKALAHSVASDDRAQAGRATQVVVALTVAGLVSAYLLPVAIQEIVAIDTTGWSSGAAELWNILDLAIVLTVFLFMIGMAMSQG